MLNNVDYWCLRENYDSADLTIYFGRRSDFGRFWYLAETAPLQQAEIIGNQQTGQLWPLVLASPPTLTDTEQLDLVRTYERLVEFTVKKIDDELRDRFEEWSIVDDIILVIGDNNGRYYLVGEMAGVRIESTLSLENNGYEITARCLERWPVRAINSDYLTSLIVLPPPQPVQAICTSSWTQICNLNWTQLCALPWSN
jgi:hypothetical protein